MPVTCLIVYGVVPINLSAVGRALARVVTSVPVSKEVRVVFWGRQWERRISTLLVGIEMMRRRLLWGRVERDEQFLPAQRVPGEDEELKSQDGR